MIPIGIVVLQLVTYSWLWAIGTNFLHKIDFIKTNAGLFKTFIIIPIVALVLILVFWMFFTFRFSFLHIYSSVDILNTSLFSVIIPIQSVFVVSIMYCYYFVARTIKQYETKKKMTFKEFYKEFILILLLPIGIWFLQPRINKFKL
jgi:hypothetical protein